MIEDYGNFGDAPNDKWTKFFAQFSEIEIIPHSEFQYSSMSDKKFIDCWSLENLRPYSAKQNVLDGVNKTRNKREINDTNG